jgi:SAM-dependent methyltransferase
MGFAEATEPYGRAFCDVIVAANVIHAGADVVTVLQRLKDLLRPGGVLVLLEVCVITVLSIRGLMRR